MSRALRICFVAPNAYPVLAGDRNIRVVGGAEVQQVLISSQLAARGYDVSMISMDFGQREGDRIAGVRLLKMHAPEAGIPGLRFFSPRLTSLWSAMRRADADVYYQRAAGAGAAFVARFARSHGKGSIFSGASDSDFDPELPMIRHARDKALYRYGLRRVDEVVVQSERQASWCRRHFARESTLIRSCYGHQGEPGRHDGLIIWVATVKPLKRPELFLDLAERLPQYRFRLVGGAQATSQYFIKLQDRARSLGNVEMTGFVPFVDVENHFDGASLVVNTSIGEGFPNTFMQAWSRGIPTISFFDAEARIDGADVGTSVADIESMTRAVQSMKQDAGAWSEHGSRALRYYLLNHTVREAVDDYERLIDRLASRSGRVVTA